jgi:hypothetical protein
MIGILAALVVGVVAAGCGALSSTGTVDSAGGASTTMSTQAVVPTTEVSPETSSPQKAGDSGDLFASLAAAYPSLPLFAPTYLPEGAKLTDSWWPVTELARPDEYEGPALHNPRVLDEGASPEIQVLFQVGEGWLMVLENFRGDVGETPGRKVGEVSGQPATLYQINGGTLIQWQHEGMWYGVFSRGLSAEESARVAAGMELVAAAAAAR